MQQIDQFVSLRELSLKEGLAEESIRRHLETGNIKGEKRNNWFRDEWFIATDEVDRVRLNPEFKTTRQRLREERAAKRSAAKVDPTLSNSTLSSLLGPDVKADAGAAPSWQNDYRQRVKIIAEELVRPLLERLEAQAVLLEQKERLLAEQGAYLRRLPDFKKQAESQRMLLEEKDQAVDALKQRLQTAEEREHQSEVQLNEVEQELAIVRSQKEEEVALLLSKLEESQAEVNRLKTPIWKKVLRAGK
jgi:chromosome segregation ATPase